MGIAVMLLMVVSYVLALRFPPRDDCWSLRDLLLAGILVGAILVVVDYVLMHVPTA